MNGLLLRNDGGIYSMDEQEKDALTAISSLNREGRRKFFEDNDLGVYSSENEVVQRLCQKGHICVSKTGAIVKKHLKTREK